MAAKLDELLAAWVVVGESLAKVDRRRMASMLETAQMVAAAYGTETGEVIYAPGRVVDLDSSAELC